MHEKDHLPKCCLAPQIKDAIHRRVVMAPLAGLDKINPTLEMIDDLLPAATMPPLDRKIILPTGANDPKGLL